MYQGMTPNLMVDDVDDAVAFYEEVMGFELVDSVPAEEGEGLQWALVAVDDIALMFQSRESLAEDIPALGGGDATGGTLNFFVQVDDVAGLHDEIADAEGVEIVVELHSTFYGTEEFSLRDPHGYVFTFAEGGEQD